MKPAVKPSWKLAERAPYSEEPGAVTATSIKRTSIRTGYELFSR
jgi:hypothetical protein